MITDQSLIFGFSNLLLFSFRSVLFFNIFKSLQTFLSVREGLSWYFFHFEIKVCQLFFVFIFKLALIYYLS